jgi:2-keto-4-pentenoate hydratase/2-oxohepta-3-ene-1,7-dioic acid hydratase in catechol pathway
VLIARYSYAGATHYGILEGDTLQRLAGSPYLSLARTGEKDPLDGARLLSPAESPRIFGVGLNYVEHIRESGSPTPEIPLMFMKPSSTAIGPGEPIVYPREATNVHFEAELAVVIGRKARRLGREEALGSLLGYTCANDVSERAIQSREMAQGALLVGKGFDTFCPLGPVIATGLDPTSLTVEARVNGERRQSASTSDLLFGVAELISWLSSAMTLLPGDVIITGTPSGVGPVVPGDVVEIEVSGVGVLRNPVIAET